MTIVLLLLGALCIGTVLSGAGILEYLLPGGLPLGNLISALAMGCIAGAAVALSPAPGWIRRLAWLALGASVAWLPFSIGLAGNPSLNFAGGLGNVWLAVTAGTLALSFLALGVAASHRIFFRQHDEKKTGAPPQDATVQKRSPG